jgi:hypothetical protein
MDINEQKQSEKESLGRKSLWSKLVPLAISAILVLSLVIFLVNSQFTLEEENRIETLMKQQFADVPGVDPSLAPDKREAALKALVLAEIDAQMRWQWAHERINRKHYRWIAAGQWFLGLFILAAAILLHDEESEHKWIKRILIVLAFLNVALPAIEAQFDYSSREEAHDHLARQLSVIRFELNSELITASQAWRWYRSLHEPAMNQYLRTHTK